MRKQNKASLTELTWKDVREDVAKVNAELAAEIDKVDPDNSFTLYKAIYPFGAGMLQSGVLHVPNESGELVPLNDSSIDPKIKKNLDYVTNNPIGIVLKNSIELYCMYNQQITTWSSMLPGHIFGLWSIMQPSNHSSFSGGAMWQTTAGARSFFLLSKISNSAGYKRIKREFNLRAAMPLGLLDQWPLLVELANAPNFNSPWFAELLFFTSKWKKKLTQSLPEWTSLQNYLLKCLWTGTAFLREQIVSDYALSLAMTSKNLRPNPYLSDTFRHIFSISRGDEKDYVSKLGFKFASNNIAGPVSQFQKIFDDVYDLRFAPTMIHPGILNVSKPLSPVYYSLEVPTVWSYTPKSRKAANKLNDLREIKHIHNAVALYILADKLGLFDTLTYQCIRDRDFRYYHSDEDILGEVESTTELPKLDSTLMKEQEQYSNKSFCHTSPFLRGCVRISAKK